MKTRNIAMTVVTVTGLMAFTGTGCSKDDKKAKQEAEALRAQLASKEAELECKNKVIGTTCAYADTACLKAKEDALAACTTVSATANALGAGTGSTTAASSDASSTTGVTATSGSSSSSSSSAGESFTVK